MLELGGIDKPSQATQELIKSLGNFDHEFPIYAKLSLDGKSTIVKIIGGDSTKGSLCLDINCDILPRTSIKFMTNNEITGSHALGSILGGSSPQLNLFGSEISTGQNANVTVQSELGTIGAGQSIYSEFQVFNSSGTILDIN